ncbi:hypothetical protein ABE504_11865 [Paenibacillus oryzisoli]|uniref:hypothetical protein n=1 Tax=Paenibacillus oryzisoli TaxID=1850517 RepID=UPI003D291D7A
MNSEVEIGTGTMRVVADYQLERWMRSIAQREPAREIDDTDWRQLAQYAAFHAVNDWYMLQPVSRTFATLTQAFEQRWTNKVQKFGSSGHYKQVKEQLLLELYLKLTDEDNAVEWPILLFECTSVWVEELDLGLSMIVQVMAQSGGEHRLTLYKYMVDASETAVQLYFHMSVVFCQRAFGQLPADIEVVDLFHGETHRLRASEMDVSKSVDYLRLAAELYLEKKHCTCCAGEDLYGNGSHLAISQ